MEFEKVFHKFPASYSASDIEQIKKAYLLAEQAYAGQTRASGLPYVSHCVGVANILLDMEVHPNLVIAGLLHDIGALVLYVKQPEKCRVILQQGRLSIKNLAELLALSHSDLLFILHLPKFTKAMEKQPWFSQIEPQLVQINCQTPEIS